MAASALAGRDAYARGIDRLERDLAERLHSLRLPTRHLRRRINVWLAIVAATFFSLWLGADSVVFGLLAAVIMLAGPWLLVRRLARLRRLKLEDQMADSMVSFSSAVRAGLSLPQAMELLAAECPHPIRQEFQQIVGEYKMGKPLERTLTEAKERMKSENFVLFSAAVLASRESGGRLNETVERIARSVLEMQRLERKIRAETAQARTSAIYMAIVPPVLLVVYFFIDPENTQLLFMTLPGQLILSISLALNIAAYFWALKILRADI